MDPEREPRVPLGVARWAALLLLGVGGCCVTPETTTTTLSAEEVEAIVDEETLADVHQGTPRLPGYYCCQLCENLPCFASDTGLPGTSGECWLNPQDDGTYHVTCSPAGCRDFDE